MFWGEVRSNKNLENDGARGMKRRIFYLILAAIASLTLSWKRNCGAVPHHESHSDSVPKYQDDKLPQTIRRSGMIFRDRNVNNVTSTEGILPSFQYGCTACPRTLLTQVAYYQLMFEQFGNTPQQQRYAKRRPVSFDIGANRGYFTYYLATLGYTVHAFEINPEMFHSLQHGILFNPSSVSERVHLYPMGMSDTVGVMSQEGGGAVGFLKPIDTENNTDAGQEVVVSTVDYFMKHINIPTNSYIDFVKIDVEGFEIAVLKGAKHTFVKSKVNALLIEMNPNRWQRSGISLSSGVNELKSLSAQYRHTYILLKKGHFSKTCPTSLENSIQSDEPTRILKGGVHMYVLDAVEDWKPLIDEMDKEGFGCNFWFSE